MQLETDTIITIGGALVSIGITWGYVRTKLSGLSEIVDKLSSHKSDVYEYKVDRHEQDIAELKNRTSTLEQYHVEMKSKIDYIYDSIKRLRCNQCPTNTQEQETR